MQGRQGWKLGLPIPAAGSQQAWPRSLLQPRVNYFSLPQRPQLRRPNRSLTGVGTTSRIGSSAREGNPSLLWSCGRCSGAAVGAGPQGAALPWAFEQGRRSISCVHRYGFLMMLQRVSSVPAGAGRARQMA